MKLGSAGIAGDDGKLVLPVGSEEKLLPPGKFERGETHVAKVSQGEFAEVHTGKVGKAGRG